MQDYFGYGSSRGHQHESAVDLYRQVYFEAYDNAINAIIDRFNQPDFKKYMSLQQLLFQAIKGNSYSEELTAVRDLYGNDIDFATLETQLQLLPGIFGNCISNAKELIECFRNLESSKRNLISDVMKVVKLILVLPATNAISERSFSALKRVKTYLRSTTSSNRINHLMLLHVHKDKTDILIMKEICQEFISRKDSRRALFGTY